MAGTLLSFYISSQPLGRDNIFILWRVSLWLRAWNCANEWPKSWDFPHSVSLSWAAVTPLFLLWVAVRLLLLWWSGISPVTNALLLKSCVHTIAVFSFIICITEILVCTHMQIYNFWEESGQCNRDLKATVTKHWPPLTCAHQFPSVCIGSSVYLDSSGQTQNLDNFAFDHCPVWKEKKKN